MAITCCDFCGRDTPNKSRICKVCMGGVRKHTEVVCDIQDDEIQMMIEVLHMEYSRDQDVARDVQEIMHEAIG